MSAYAVQQCLFDQLRRWSAGPGTPVVTEGYDLAGDELTVIGANDIAGLYTLGVHPVLLNAWCRATGYTRDDYRQLLAPVRVPDVREPRWRNSSR